MLFACLVGCFFFTLTFLPFLLAQNHLYSLLSVLLRSQVGRPIPVIQSDKPTKEEIIAVQKLYIEELLRYVLLFPRPYRPAPRGPLCSPSHSHPPFSTPHLMICAFHLLGHLRCHLCLLIGEDRIWNKYKDTFARERTQELSIID